MWLANDDVVHGRGKQPPSRSKPRFDKPTPEVEIVVEHGPQGHSTIEVRTPRGENDSLKHVNSSRQPTHEELARTQRKRHMQEKPRLLGNVPGGLVRLRMKPLTEETLQLLLLSVSW